MASVQFISEEQVKNVLNWKDLYNAVETSMASVAEKNCFQNPRSFTNVIGGEGVLLTMPAHLKNEKYGALGCKLVTAFKNNTSKNLPNILANILLFDESTGMLNAVIEGTEITTKRTAVASAVATKEIFLKKAPSNPILSIVGAGVQGRMHAIAFYNYFKFNQIRIWNRTISKAVSLADELNKMFGKTDHFVAKENLRDCLKDADCIVTATFSPSALVYLSDLKPNVHINAVGAALNHFSELDLEIYKTSDVYIDHYEGANIELSGLLKQGISFKSEIGSLLIKKIQASSIGRSVFQSLGMAVEDCAVARLVYDFYKNKTQSTETKL